MPATELVTAPVYDWVPTEANEASPVAGYLRLYAARATTLYRLEEFVCDDGRGFQLVKSEHTAGTDKEAPEYAVFAGVGGLRCECRGFLRWSHCKHVDAIAELISTGKL